MERPNKISPPSLCPAATSLWPSSSITVAVAWVGSSPPLPFSALQQLVSTARVPLGSPLLRGRRARPPCRSLTRIRLLCAFSVFFSRHLRPDLSTRPYNLLAFSPPATSVVPRYLIFRSAGYVSL